MNDRDDPAIAKRGFDYATARELANSADPAVRRALAASLDVSPEILYFLAEDSDASVREVVAANPSCPAKGNLLLADDPSLAVRTALAEKVGRQNTAKPGSLAKQVLERLVADQVTEVRRIIAEALKDVADADPLMINRLARDAELIVAAPILEFSPVLTDQDLLHIIAENPVSGALSAIARRNYVDSSVTSAIVATNDRVAITHMLKNGNAQLQENVLDSLIERSAHEPTWQEPLVYRPELNARSAKRLAELVAVHLLDRIMSRKDLAPETIQAVAQVVGERLRSRDVQSNDAQSGEMLEQRYSAKLEKAKARYAKGQLDELTMMVMLLVDPAEDLVVALAARAGLPVKVVLDIVETRAPRAICALAWAAGLSALFAAEMQVHLAQLPLDQVLKPAANGRSILSDEEMRWQLTLYGVTPTEKNSAPS